MTLVERPDGAGSVRPRVRFDTGGGTTLTMGGRAWRPLLNKSTHNSFQMGIMGKTFCEDTRWTLRIPNIHVYIYGLSRSIQQFWRL